MHLGQNALFSSLLFSSLPLVIIFAGKMNISVLSSSQPCIFFANHINSSLSIPPASEDQIIVNLGVAQGPVLFLWHFCRAPRAAAAEAVGRAPKLVIFILAIVNVRKEVGGEGLRAGRIQGVSPFSPPSLARTTKDGGG